MIKYDKRILITGILLIFSILLMLVGISYSFFKAVIEGNESAQNSVVQTSVLKLEFAETEVLNLSNILPGASSSKTFTVKNTGTGVVIYNIKLIDVVNTFLNDELVYEITSTNDGGTKIETPIPLSDNTLLSAISISPGITQTYTLTVTFKETLLNQNYNQGALFSGKLQIDTEEVAYSKILADNTVQSDASINFDSTVGDGLYYTADNQYGEDSQRIYYFRGRVENNWVVFGGFLWRIVRTTSEGGIKLSYSGDGSTTSSGFIINSAFGSSGSSKYHVGYTYNTDLNGFNGAQTNSIIKTAVDNWYTNNLSSYASYLSDTAIYCNDKNSETNSYPAATRIITNKRPTYACPSTNSSRYTVSTETGNGYLSNPIALLTADEIMYAGVKYNASSLNSYIMDNTTGVNYWWTMTPYNYALNSSRNFTVSYSGSLGYNFVYDVNGVRPAVSLKSSVMFIGGNGTKEKPYIIE